MAIRKAKLIGIARAINDLAEITIKINGQQVFSGSIDTKIVDETPSLQLFNDMTNNQTEPLCEFDIDSSLSGNIQVEISVTKGTVYINQITCNYVAKTRRLVTIPTTEMIHSTSDYQDVTNDPSYDNYPVTGMILGFNELIPNLPSGQIYRFVYCQSTIGNVADEMEYTFTTPNIPTFNQNNQVTADGWQNVTIDENLVSRLTPLGTLRFESDFDNAIGFFQFCLNSGQSLYGNYYLDPRFLIDPTGNIQTQIENVSYASEMPTINFATVIGWNMG